MIMVLGTHFSRASDIVVPDHLTTTPSLPIEAYRDLFGNWCSRILAPAGPAAADRRRHRPRLGPARHRCSVCAAECRRGLAGGHARLSSRQPLLRDRSPFGAGVAAVRQHAAGMAARPGDLRLRPQPHHVRLPACTCRPRRRGRPSTSATACAATTPTSPSPSAAAMNIPARYCTGYLGDIGIPPVLGPDGLRRLVRGLPRRPVVHVRSSQQRAAHRARPDRTADAMRPTCRSPTPSAPTRCRASRSGRTRSSRSVYFAGEARRSREVSRRAFALRAKVPYPRRRGHEQRD